MTEQEARNVWCPKLQITYSAGWFVSNRGDKQIHIEKINACCIASECAWWVWNKPACQNKETGTIHSASMATDYPDKYILCEPSGYCGAIR